jgi:hypothetical protein
VGLSPVTVTLFAQSDWMPGTAKLPQGQLTRAVYDDLHQMTHYAHGQATTDPLPAGFVDVEEEIRCIHPRYWADLRVQVVVGDNDSPALVRSSLEVVIIRNSLPQLVKNYGCSIPRVEIRVIGENRAGGFYEPGAEMTRY